MEPQNHTDSGLVSTSIQRAIDDGRLSDDPAQQAAISILDDILANLKTPVLGNKKSALGWMFGKKPQVSATSHRGLYLWGGVGRGKTMLMDLFFDHADNATGDLKKRRVHFHAFMQDVHSRIHVWRQKQKSAKDKSADPIPPLAKVLAEEAQLLCFDEFAVTDVADAMLLARLFTGLFEQGVTVVATSNVVPDLLYKNGLNRSFFLPFIELVKTRMEVLELASPTDYRMQQLVNGDVFIVGDEADRRFDELWRTMTDGLTIEPAVVEVAGRKTTYTQSSGGLVRESFANLCEKPLGAGDYLALADRFHTVFLESVPILQFENRNAVKRFITLIDTLYDKGLVLIARADAVPDELYPVDHGTEAFEFQRTISRLTEMQGQDWLKRSG